jgi:hypothetical protein
MTSNKVKLTDNDVFSELRYVWLFQCSNRTALHAATLNRKAGNLPKDVCRDGKWTLSGQLIVGPKTEDSAGINVDALKAAVQNDGYYLWSAESEPLPTTLRLMR